MNPKLRLAALCTAAAATLALAGSARTAPSRTHASAYKPVFSVSYNTIGKGSTTFHFDFTSSGDATAAVKLYSPAQTEKPASLPKIGQQVGSASGVFAGSAGANLVASGPIVAVDPAKASGGDCAPGSHAGAWQIDLKSQTQQLTPATVFLDPLSGLETQFGSYRLIVCFASPTTAALGAVPRTFNFTVSGPFLRTTTYQLRAWRGFFTTFQSGKTTQDVSGQVEARSWVGGAVQLKVHRVGHTNRYRLIGGVHQGVLGIPGVRVLIYKGASGTRLKHLASTLTNTKGTFRTAGMLRPRQRTLFQVRVRVPARLHVEGCQPVLPGGGSTPCVGSTYGGWTAASALVSVKS